MGVLGLDHYNLRADAATLESLRDFYRDVVGLRVGDRPPFASRGFWLYAGDRPVLHLSECAPGERRGRQGAFDHAAFACEGRTAFEQKLDGLGIAFERATVPGRGIVQLFLSDPAGNGIELSFAASEARP